MCQHFRLGAVNQTCVALRGGSLRRGYATPVHGCKLIKTRRNGEPYLFSWGKLTKGFTCIFWRCWAEPCYLQWCLVWQNGALWAVQAQAAWKAAVHGQANMGSLPITIAQPPGYLWSRSQSVTSKVSVDFCCLLKSWSHFSMRYYMQLSCLLIWLRNVMKLKAFSEDFSAEGYNALQVLFLVH